MSSVFYIVLLTLSTFTAVIEKISKISPWWWLLAWWGLNMVTAAFSPIDADEAYYWMYAQQLDWGYFDHPPAVALLINLGMHWLPGELGLRLGHVLIGGLTMLIIWDILDRPQGKQAWVAALLLAALPMLQVYGFIATPDGPLLLFTSLHLWSLKRFLQVPSYANGILIGVVMAGLLYSKYHGVILILFSILPCLAWLIRQPAAWLAVVVGAALYAPHLYWQYAHDYPSFRYHLSGRNDPYELKFTTEYLLNQLVIFNPFLLYFYFKALLRRPQKEGMQSADYRFHQSCRWLIFLTLGFFLYSTTKGGTEAQWTALLSIPLIYLLYRAFLEQASWEKWLLRVGYLSLGLFLVARLALIAPREWLPFQKPFDAQPWVEQLAEQANGLPVLFENSYRDASHYRFYAPGEKAWTFTDVDYRPNQYDIWVDDTSFHHQKVLVAGKENWMTPNSKPFDHGRHHLNLQVVDSFQVAKLASLSLVNPVPPQMFHKQSIQLDIMVELNELAEGEQLDLDAGLPLQLYAIFQYVGDGWQWFPLEPLRRKTIVVGDKQLLYRGTFEVPDSLPETELLFQLGLGYEGMPPLRGQSELWPVTVRTER